MSKSVQLEQLQIHIREIQAAFSQQNAFLEEALAQKNPDAILAAVTPILDAISRFAFYINTLGLSAEDFANAAKQFTSNFEKTSFSCFDAFVDGFVFSELFKDPSLALALAEFEKLVVIDTGMPNTFGNDFSEFYQDSLVLKDSLAANAINTWGQITQINQIIDAIQTIKNDQLPELQRQVHPEQQPIVQTLIEEIDATTKKFRDPHSNRLLTNNLPQVRAEYAKHFKTADELFPHRNPLWLRVLTNALLICSVGGIGYLAYYAFKYGFHTRSAHAAQPVIENAKAALTHPRQSLQARL